jgi:hypothetical protein
MIPLSASLFERLKVVVVVVVVGDGDNNVIYFQRLWG